MVVDVIEAFLQLAPALLLGRAGHGLRCGSGRLLDALAGEPELIPPNLSAPDQRHRWLFFHFGRTQVEPP
jgi:hypothetical protein